MLLSFIYELAVAFNCCKPAMIGGSEAASAPKMRAEARNRANAKNPGIGQVSVEERMAPVEDALPDPRG